MWNYRLLQCLSDIVLQTVEMSLLKRYVEVLQKKSVTCRNSSEIAAILVDVCLKIKRTDSFKLICTQIQ
jgi:hypothetical protein